MSWQPTAPLANLKLRARILAKIREFFAERGVLEVETPLISHSTVSDLHIESITAYVGNQPTYLQTSPEYAMKRLLAAGSKDIYQIGKAFRQDQIGRIHNPEFTLLEWYRLNFDHHDLMREMDQLLQAILATPPAEYVTYRQAFQHYMQIDPFIATIAELQNCAAENHIFVVGQLETVDAWLQILFSHCIEPNIGHDRPFFLYDFPVTQAALARIRAEMPPVASRFEVYLKGTELANGFHELQDAAEQRSRFTHDLARRAQTGLAQVPIDEHFLQALAHGLPDCAGVALGIDRLVMVAAGAESLKEVLSFDFARA